MMFDRIMSEGKFFFDWSEFEAASSGRFRRLVGNKEFSDVTLVAEDGKRIFAHQLILATGCAFFRKLLEAENSPKPLIFFRGVDASLIEPLLDFLYIGKAEVNEEVLPKFLAFAEDLRVDGLVASGHKGNSNQDENKEDLKETITRITNVPTPEQLSVSKIENIESVFQKSKLILPIADEQIVNPEKGRNGRFRCNLCEKTIKFRHNFRRHVRIRHNNPLKPCKPADLIRIPEKNQDGLYHCQYCDKTTQHRDTFRKHMKNKHPVSQTTTP